MHIHTKINILVFRWILEAGSPLANPYVFGQGSVCGEKRNQVSAMFPQWFWLLLSHVSENVPSDYSQSFHRNGDVRETISLL